MLTQNLRWHICDVFCWQQKCFFPRHDKTTMSHRESLSPVSYFHKWVRRAFCAGSFTKTGSRHKQATDGGQNRRTFEAHIIAALNEHHCQLGFVVNGFEWCARLVNIQSTFCRRTNSLSAPFENLQYRPSTSVKDQRAFVACECQRSAWNLCELIEW